MTLSELNNRNADDLVLFNKIIKGDESAISSLYEKYGQLLYTLAIRITMSIEDSEDVVHNVFLEIWNKPNNYQPAMGSFYSWIVSMTRSMSLTKKRAKGIQKQHHNSEISPSSFHAEIEHRESSAGKMIDEERTLLAKTLTQLSVEERKALVFAYYEGYSQSEISQLLKLSTDIIKFRIDNALTTICTSLREGN